MTLAGPEAEAKFTGRRDSRAARGDHLTCLGLAGLLCVGDAEASAMFRWLQLRTYNLLPVPAIWGQVLALDAALLEHETLPAQQARAICNAAPDADEPTEED